MTTTILTSLHILVALITIPWAVILLSSAPKKNEFRAISAFLFVLAISSFAFAFELNAISFDQALPWIVIQIFVAYSTSSIGIYVSLIVLRPNLAKKLWISIPLWILILFPLTTTLLDVIGVSEVLFNSHLVINISEMANTYQGGYLSVNEAASGPLYNIFLIQLIVLDLALIIFPCLFVAIKDRKTNPTNSRIALVLFVSISLTTIFQAVFTGKISSTVAPLFANLLFGSGFFVAGYLLISSEYGHLINLRELLQTYPMRYKLYLGLAIIILPSIVFIAFSNFSLFQNSLLTTSAQNLNQTSSREARLITNTVDDYFIHLEQLTENNRILTLLDNRQNTYQGLSTAQIEQRISGREIQWQGQDGLLTSTIMESVNSLDIRYLMEEYNEIANIAIIDPYGALVAAGIRPQNYQYNNTPWWPQISSNQSYYVGPVEWEPNLNSYTTTLAMPILSEEGQFRGVVTALYKMDEIFQRISMAPASHIQFAIATSEGIAIPASADFDPENTFLLPASVFAPTDTEAQWQTIQIDSNSHLIKAAPLAGTGSHYSVPWMVIAYQPVDQALASLFTARTGTIITSIFILLFSTTITTILTRSITEPLTKLTDAAEKILEGSREISVDITSNDELGTLSTTFNQMVAEIYSLVTGLEETIDQRTQDLERRALQLETSALVAQQASEIQDLTTLLDSSVELISEKFGFYHTGIFLLDEQRKYAVLTAANSEGGKRMLARGHKLQVGRVGVVGYCAGMGQPRIAQDVGADIVYYDNPDMPYTRSEMALPLFVRGEVIGVIDVQSTEASAFNQEDISILQILANQIALAIEKARLLESSQKSLEELQRLYGKQAALAWHQKLTGEEIAYQYSSTGFTKLLRDSHQQATEYSGAELNKEIKYRGQVIGKLDFIRDQQEGSWSEEEEALIEEILEQTALALENARLVDQIKLRSDQIQLLQEITAMAASILDENLLLEEVAEKLHTSLPNHQCGVVLYDNAKNQAHLAACAPMTEQTQTIGAVLPIHEDPYNLQEVQTKEAFVIQNVQDTSRYKTFANSFQVENSQSLIILPLIIREQPFGYIYMAEDEPERKLDPEEHNLYGQIQAQIATAVESARLFAAEKQAREASAALLEITQISSASLDINEVLNEATYRSAEAIQANRCTILLLDEREKVKPLISVYSDGTQMENEEWDMLVNKIKTTYQDVPLRTLAARFRVPLLVDSTLTYDEFPVGWTQAFGIEKILMVPLISQNKVIGSMIYDLISAEKSFSQNQVELAQTIAGQIATTLENANLFDQAIQRAERERQVTDITAKIRASNDPDEILETAISELRLALAKQEIQEKQKIHTSKRTASVSAEISTNNGKERS